MADPNEYGAPGANMNPGQGAASEASDPVVDKGFDFERSYRELQPEFTRRSQELASTRERLSDFEDLFAGLHDSDPEVQRQAMEYLGLEPADTGPATQQLDEEFIDPLEEEIKALREQVGTLSEARELETSRTQDAEIEQLRDEYIDEEIGSIEQFLQRQLSEREQEVIGNLAIAMENDDGIPDVRAAYQAVYGEEGVLELNRKQWIESKAGAAQAPSGRTVTTTQKPRTAAERVDYMDNRWRELGDQQ